MDGKHAVEDTNIEVLTHAQFAGPIQEKSTQKRNYILLKLKHERPTMHWQKTGLDQQTSVVVRYQLWFGARPLRLIF